MEKRERNSSIELLRIMTIILIIFHHFNIHGMWIPTEFSLSSTWQLFISCMTGWGGNVGNEIFMIITGYFMITGKVHWKRIVMLLLTMFFYSWIIAGFFYGVMDWPLTAKEISKYAIPIWTGENWFVCCYLIFMCFVPFINPFFKTLSKGRYQILLFLNYFLFIFHSCIKFAWEYVYERRFYSVFYYVYVRWIYSLIWKILGQRATS